MGIEVETGDTYLTKFDVDQDVTTSLSCCVLFDSHKYA